MGFFVQCNCKSEDFHIVFIVLVFCEAEAINMCREIKLQKKLRFQNVHADVWHWWMGQFKLRQAVMWLGYNIPSVYRVAFHNIHRLAQIHGSLLGRLYDGFWLASHSKETSRDKQIEKYQMQIITTNHIKLLCVSLCTELAYNLTGINIWSLKLT